VLYASTSSRRSWFCSRRRRASRRNCRRGAPADRTRRSFRNGNGDASVINEITGEAIAERAVAVEDALVNLLRAVAVGRPADELHHACADVGIGRRQPQQRVARHRERVDRPVIKVSSGGVGPGHQIREQLRGQKPSIFQPFNHRSTTISAYDILILRQPDPWRLCGKSVKPDSGRKRIARGGDSPNKSASWRNIKPRPLVAGTATTGRGLCEHTQVIDVTFFVLKSDGRRCRRRRGYGDEGPSRKAGNRS